MPVLRPYRPSVRPFLQGGYFNAPYVFHAKFAEHGPQYIRAFMLLQKDVLELFDYVEPADENLSTYSYRIHELHMRLCIEEANCRAILSENRYVNPKGEAEWWTIVDYRKLNPT